MQPIRAIVARFSPEYSFQAMERVLHERPFEHCAIISSGKPRYFSALKQHQQDWFFSSDIRGGSYEGVDWNTLEPLDKELIEDMRECEAIFMNTISRQEWKTSIPYAERRRMYLKHLRFWNHYITSNKINLYLSAWLPHESPDVVIHHLCMKYNIPVVCFDVSTERDSSYIVHGFTESTAQVGKRYEELLVEYKDVQDPLRIPLGQQFAERYEALTTAAGQKPPLQNQKYPLYLDHLIALLKRNPLQVVWHGLTYCTPSGMKRACGALKRYWVIRRYRSYYDRHAVKPDLTKRYVYMALHFQPEMSTVPMGGGFSEQVLIAQMLNAYLPDDVLIYVKEHPRASSWLSRSEEFYREFLDMKRVRLVARDTDSFALREHCEAVATITGSVGFEALFRGKPVFMFGHRFYQYARGVYQIYTNADCKNAVDAVFTAGKKPSRVESRLFLKAMEDTRIHGLLNPWDRKVSHLSDEEHTVACSEAILKELATQFS